MKYKNIHTGQFRSRPNRFIAHVEINGTEEVCHVKNTGRCRELLIPGASVYLEKNDKKERKTAYDLVAVEKGKRLINMDSQIPNRVVEEWLRAGNLFGTDAKIRPETKYGNSRFDFYIEAGDRKIFMEVKGVTLEEQNVVRFPDAPTERGIKHIHELCKAKEDGYEAYLFLVIQMKDVLYFEPNNRTQEAFGAALKEAKQAGVKLLAYDCFVEPDSIVMGEPVEIRL